MIVTTSNIQAISISGRGDVRTELIYLQVLKDINLSAYVILVTEERAPGQLAAGSHPSYWFGKKDIKAGDTIALFSGIGKVSGEGLEVPHPKGGLTHVYFWGLSNALFSDPGSRAVVMEINVWTTVGGG